MAEVVEVVEERRDSFDRRPHIDGQHLRRVALIGSAVGTDPAVRPRLRDNPIGHLAVVAYLVPAQFVATRAERRATSACIDDDHGISGGVESLGRSVVAVVLQPRIHQVQRTPVPCSPHDRRDPRAWLEVSRQPHVDRDLYPIAHLDVERLKTGEVALRLLRNSTAGGNAGDGHGDEQQTGELNRGSVYV